MLSQVRDWYVDSFKELRSFPEVRDAETELKFTSLLKVRFCVSVFRLAASITHRRTYTGPCSGAMPPLWRLIHPAYWCLQQAIYSRHRNVVPVMAMGVAELKQELSADVGLGDLPEIHQVLH